jgi:threonylcarbamoyladenosine tRNA methylthiotransferase MtaB
VRSRPLEDIAAEVQALARNGYKEVVLVGINLSAYGTDLGLTLCDAVEAVCAIDGIERVRLGSLEPEYLDKSTIKRLAKQEKLCPHFHLSLQSGCDATLKRMNRHYTSAEYYEIGQNLREHFENVALTTDVMVGFAGETDEEFEQSLSFVRKVGFAKVHVFAYSIRTGTRAATFENQVAPDVKKQRSQVMLAVVEESRRYFLNTQVGRVEPVLFEQQDSEGFWFGHTRNYTPVKVKFEEDLQSQIVSTKLTAAVRDECQGELIV